MEEMEQSDFERLKRSIAETLKLLDGDTLDHVTKDEMKEIKEMLDEIENINEGIALVLTPGFSELMIECVSELRANIRQRELLEGL